MVGLRERNCGLIIQALLDRDTASSFQNFPRLGDPVLLRSQRILLFKRLSLGDAEVKALFVLECVYAALDRYGLSTFKVSLATIKKRHLAVERARVDGLVFSSRRLGRRHGIGGATLNGGWRTSKDVLGRHRASGTIFRGCTKCFPLRQECGAWGVAAQANTMPLAAEPDPAPILVFPVPEELEAVVPLELGFYNKRENGLFSHGPIDRYPFAGIEEPRITQANPDAIVLRFDI